ncbi:MAG: amidohydrolase family protein [Planctomycetes bacterium]|nr:amidohydrolase family protein [Planctomycetota bacterium]
MKPMHPLLTVAAAGLAALLLADSATSQRPRRRPDGAPPGAPTPEAPPPAEAKPEPKVESWTAIQGGDVYLGDGTILRRATVLIGDDKIRGVGHDLQIPEGAHIVDATGKVVSPGFCIVHASGFGAPRSGNDVRDGLNPFDPQIKMGLAAGITSFLWTSSGGSDKPGGKSCVVKLAFGDLEGMVGPEDTVVSMRVPLNVQQMRAFRELVRQAREHQQKLRELEGKEGTKPPKAPNGTEELLAIMDGRKTLWISGQPSFGGRFGGGGGPSEGFGVDQIRQAMEIAELVGQGVVLDVPVAAWVIPDEIAATGSMVIDDPRSRTEPIPGREATTGSNIAQAAILAEVGVPVAVTTGGGGFGGPSIGTGGILGQDLNTPTVDACYAVRGGLPNRRAIRTLALDAARIMGAEARIGSLQEGRDADVLILDGDPLHYKTFVEIAFVNGKLVYEKDREPFYRHVQR